LYHYFPLAEQTAQRQYY